MVGRASNWDLNGDGLLSSQESAGDLALLGLRSRIGDTTGILTPRSESADVFGNMVGYPARGTGMMAESVYADASPAFGVYNISSGLGAGASGGPLIETLGGVNYVIGALSSGDANNTVSTYAGLFGAGTWDWLQSAMAANDNLLPYVPQITITGGSNDDTLTGNELANTISGSAGNDTITGLAGNDAIDGGTGIDVSVYTGARAGYTLNVGASSVTVTDLTASRDGTDTLTGIERLKFADYSLALDVSGAAGVTVKILAAVFGKESITFKNFVATGLAYLDRGTSYQDLMGLALQDKLGPGYSLEAEVKLLYTNLVGVTPPPSELAFYMGLVQSGQYTQNSLGVLAAEAPANLANVDLVGLASTGIAFTVPG